MTTTDFYFAVASGYVLLPLAFAVGQKRGVQAAKAEMLAHKPSPKPVPTVHVPRKQTTERPPVINPHWLYRDRPMPL